MFRFQALGLALVLLTAGLEETGACTGGCPTIELATGMEAPSDP